MTLLDDLRMVATAYAEHSGVSMRRLSGMVFGHRHVFERLANGRDIETASLERAMFWFASHWPADLPWPARRIRRRWPACPPIRRATAKRKLMPTQHYAPKGELTQQQGTD